MDAIIVFKASLEVLETNSGFRKRCLISTVSHLDLTFICSNPPDVEPDVTNRAIWNNIPQLSHICDGSRQIKLSLHQNNTTHLAIDRRSAQIFDLSRSTIQE